MEIKQNRCDVFVLSREGDETSSGVLDVLSGYFITKTARNG